MVFYNKIKDFKDQGCCNTDIIQVLKCITKKNQGRVVAFKGELGSSDSQTLLMLLTDIPGTPFGISVNLNVLTSYVIVDVICYSVGGITCVVSSEQNP